MCVKKACLPAAGILPSSVMNVHSEGRKFCFSPALIPFVLSFALVEMYLGNIRKNIYIWGLTGSEKTIKLIFNLHFDSS